MYQTGELIKFSPFVFKNGNQPKPKYCIVLGQIDDKVTASFSFPRSTFIYGEQVDEPTPSREPSKLA